MSGITEPPASDATSAGAKVTEIPETPSPGSPADLARQLADLEGRNADLEQRIRRAEDLARVRGARGARVAEALEDTTFLKNSVRAAGTRETQLLRANGDLRRDVNTLQAANTDWATAGAAKDARIAELRAQLATERTERKFFERTSFALLGCAGVALVVVLGKHLAQSNLGLAPNTSDFPSVPSSDQIAPPADQVVLPTAWNGVVVVPTGVAASGATSVLPVRSTPGRLAVEQGRPLRV